VSFSKGVILPLVIAAIFAMARTSATGGEAPGGDPENPTSPHLDIRRDESGLMLSGEVSSVAHEQILRDLVGQAEGPTAATLELDTANPTPPGWAIVTELTLRAMLLTHFSAASITEDSVSLRGVTTDAESWSKALHTLENALLPGMRLETRVTVVSSGSDFESLCRRLFDAALQERDLEFTVATSEVGTSAAPLLDRLLETAADCPTATIAVRASGDGPATVTANRALAEARAQSVVEYLIGRGLNSTRISALPPADAPGNRQRQVTFQVRFAPPRQSPVNSRMSATATP
jgi:hypothetical protein